MIEDILPHLDKVKKYGNKYQACCPVHNDKSPSMTITEKAGKVLMYCFSCGAKGIDVVKTLGLSPDILFVEQYIRPSGLTSKQKDEMLQDKFVIEMADQAKTYADFKRVKLARERLAYLEGIK